MTVRDSRVELREVLNPVADFDVEGVAYLRSVAEHEGERRSSFRFVSMSQSQRSLISPAILTWKNLTGMCQIRSRAFVRSARQSQTSLVSCRFCDRSQVKAVP
jgi:hypothetical protein